MFCEQLFKFCHDLFPLQDSKKYLTNIKLYGSLKLARSGNSPDLKINNLNQLYNNYIKHKKKFAPYLFTIPKIVLWKKLQMAKYFLLGSRLSKIM